MSKYPRLPSGKIDIKSLDISGIEDLFESIDEPVGRAHRTYRHLWHFGVQSFDDMPTVSKRARQKLKKIAEISFLETEVIEDASDGTRKFLWRIPQGGVVESVLIPDENRERGKDRMTLCVSSQWGCAMKCSFCLTGDLGLKGHLSAAQITNQVLQVSQTLPEHKRITNIVMMGMGEPLHNYDNLIVALNNMMHNHGLNLSHRKITVSTVGLVPALRKLANTLPVNLAISLNSTTEEQRKQVMPITAKYSLAELLQTCRELPLPSGKRITFEYVMMAGFNDSFDDAQRLIELLSDIPTKINLIPYNENPARSIRRPTEQHVKAFQHYIVSRGMHCSIRTTRGIDISAACGQLGKAFENMTPSIYPQESLHV